MKQLLGAEMYKDIITICWSIREVNRNLSDRQSTSDYSIRYLKKACSDLAVMMRDLGRTAPDGKIEVIDKNGQKKLFSFNQVSDMLYDTKKILEFNLIDNISQWAQAQQVA